MQLFSFFISLFFEHISSLLINFQATALVAENTPSARKTGISATASTMVPVAGDG